MQVQSQLAILGGPKSIKSDPEDLFKWPIITSEDEEAVLEVLRRGAMSSVDVTLDFEREFAKWQSAEFALAFNNGTSALQAAMFGCRVGIGDEIICPSITYWASALPCFSLGATPVFADIDANTLCLDPKDLEHRITKRTKAIVVVHYLGYPADMDPIMEIARRHGLKVIEDVSHAQGGVYRGRKLGSIGDVAGISLMSGKPLVAGEGGMLVTNDRVIYDRAIAWGHYERFNPNIQTEELRQFAGLPMGGCKCRMHQLSSAVGRTQLRHFDVRCEEIREALNYFWDGLEGVPGLKPHRTPKDSSSKMGGWYSPHGIYLSDELGGLSVARFVEAIKAEGFTDCVAGCNTPLHLHPLFNTCDIYGHGKPTRIANSDSDLRQWPGDLPVSERINGMTFSIPYFKRSKADLIDQYIHAYRKVAEHFQELLEGDTGNPAQTGAWRLFR